MPPNQWTKEVDLWFASGLAALQQSVLEWIAKPWPTGHPEARYPIVNMTGLGAQYAARGLSSQKDALCRNQLIRSSAAVQNFSVLALFVVVVLSLTIIITAAVLPFCVDASRHRRRQKGANLSAQAEAGRVARIADGKYGLLAMALQGAGVKGWVRGRGDIPVTEARVAVATPQEMAGVASYPDPIASHADRKLRPKSLDGDSESGGSISKTNSEPETERISQEKETPGAGQAAEKWDNKLKRRGTEVTLVGSPVNGGFLEKTISGKSTESG